MRTYEKHKDSSIERIGKIPEHWQETKFKTIIDFQEGPGILAKDFHTVGVPLIRISGVKSEKVTLDGCNYLDEDLVEKKWEHFRLKVGDIVISCSASTDLVSEVDKSVEDSILYTGLIRLRPKTNDITKDFIKNIVRSNYYQTEIKTQQTGSTIQHYGPVHLKKIKIVLPTVVEQERINSYLDKKTAEIDQLIAEKEQLVALYQEEKTAIINQAVTKGINPDVKLKDSGIEWLGCIPEHWVIKKLNWCFKTIGSGTTPKADNQDYYFNGTHNWLLTGDLNDGEIHKTTKRITDKALNDYSSLKEYGENSVVIAMYGATIGKLGVLKIPTTVNQACCVLSEPTHLNYDFTFFLLLSARQEIINMSYGGGQPNISQELLKQFKIQVPPKEEQTEIVQHIEKESARIDAKIAKAEKYINLLTEYRTALISEVVTGKIKVID